MPAPTAATTRSCPRPIPISTDADALTCIQGTVMRSALCSLVVTFLFESTAWAMLGTSTRKVAPRASGSMMTFRRDARRAPGCNETVDPSTRSRANGIVKMPRTLLATVRRMAKAVFPPTACVSAMPLESVVGMQQKIARPIDSPVGRNGMARQRGPIAVVNPRMVRRPNINGMGDRKAAAASACFSRRPEIKKMPKVQHFESPAVLHAAPGAGKIAASTAKVTRPTGRNCVSRNSSSRRPGDGGPGLGPLGSADASAETARRLLVR
mmetsp:Transcript_39317/g.100418  ORF Transcript_39317/g.100418 Transcript_39317/m.100418 type:complete len:267 (-) Transcript_39317:317-1117(-)